MNHVLIVDDDADSAASLRDLVCTDQFTVAVAHTLRDARRQIALQAPDLVLLDLQLPDGNGLDLFSDPQLVCDSEIVLVTGHASLDTSIEALRKGAADYLVKPIAMKQLERVLARCGARTPAAATDDGSAPLPRDPKAPTGRFGYLWGQTPPMQRVFEQIERVSGTSVNVFITGESGTGKEVVAQTVHAMSKRHAGPFLAVNCGAISPHLIESEIFGHEKGSFTGAERQHQGFFERAAGGTLFLDEVTEMPLDLQVKLLRVLESNRFMRVGSTQSQTADVRVVAATNRPPHEAVSSGKLREDLYYRLNVFPIDLPPLRKRLDDVDLLARQFLGAISAREGRVKHLSQPASRRLQQYDWPGNVRELRNVMQRAYVMARDDVIGTEWLPGGHGDEDLAHDEAVEAQAGGDTGLAPGTPSITLPVGVSMAEAERLLIHATLDQCKQQKERTAAVLGISLKTLYNRLKAYTADGSPSS